jgi:NAD(P)-dependent dehydrogenase (short-subunit alcohol dehydrogenase family)
MSKKFVSNILMVAAWLLTVLVTASPAVADQSVVQKAVLVTGASSGIGRNIAERLAAEGYFVYAGARKTQDLKALSSIGNVQGVRLDVTIQSDIDAAVETVKAGGLGLYGIVNNAGVIVMGVMAEMDEADLEFVFDVNVFGPYRVTRAFAPMIIESKGRISNISSLAGIATGPAYGAYSMSKHAIEAFSDSLASEMRPLGVHVSAIKPGAYNSSASTSYCKRRNAQDSSSNQSLFEELSKDIAGLCDNETANQYPEPDRVADAVMDALFSEDPKEDYLAVSASGQSDFVIRNVLQDLVEINRDYEYSLSRDQLVELLDETLAPVAEGERR